jgi:hypothetical protein
VGENCNLNPLIVENKIFCFFTLSLNLILSRMQEKVLEEKKYIQLKI